MPFDATPVKTEELAVIDRMIELLSDPKHWCKGRGRTADGEAFCVLGALNEAVSERSGDVRPVALALHRAVWPSHSAAHRFNDDPATTHADVMALLMRVRAQFT